MLSISLLLLWGRSRELGDAFVPDARAFELVGRTLISVATDPALTSQAGFGSATIGLTYWRAPSPP